MNADITFGAYAQTSFPFDIEYEYTATPIYVVGSPNMGKSTLLGNLAEQFCAAGEGVLLLDIKGDLAREVAARTRYPERVVYVKMGEIPFPGGDIRMWTINPFEGHRDSNERRKQLAVSILESFERMGLAQLGTMANIRGTIRNAINLAMTLPEPTYLDLLLIIIDEAYRKRLLASQKHVDHITRRHWEDLDDRRVTTTYMRRSEINTSRNRLETLLDGSDFNLPAGRYHSTLRLREWLDEGRMILIDLGLPLVRETGVDLGNMIMAQMMTETFLRPETERNRTWRIIADECHLFVGSMFAQLIDEARSYKVFPVVAHQDRGQFFEDGRERREGNLLLGALGHAGISLHLKGSREDRVALASLFGQEVVELFFRLKQHSAIVNYYSSLAGSYAYETVVLNDWWADPVPGQLAELQLASYAHTVPKKELVAANRRNYWDYLEAAGKDGTRESNARPNRSPKTQANPPAPHPRRSETGQDQRAGRAAPRPDGDPHPGGSRPPRPADERDAPGSAFPRPPRPAGGRSA